MTTKQDSRRPWRLQFNKEDGVWEIWTAQDDTLGSRNNYVVAGSIQTEDEAKELLHAVNCHDELLEALKRINRTSVETTFHGNVNRFQEWLDAFTADAIQKAEGAA